MDYEETYKEKNKQEEEVKKISIDYEKKYRERIKQEEEDGKINREKRQDKKNKEKLKLQIETERLKEHSTGLITWKRKGTLFIFEGYIDNVKCFKINHGIYKYSLSTYVETGVKKDKSPKTSFELNKLQMIAESIAKRIPSKDKKK